MSMSSPAYDMKHRPLQSSFRMSGCPMPQGHVSASPSAFLSDEGTGGVHKALAVVLVAGVNVVPCRPMTPSRARPHRSLSLCWPRLRHARDSTVYLNQAKNIKTTEEEAM